jgi:hypothetical protein
VRRRVLSGVAVMAHAWTCGAPAPRAVIAPGAARGGAARRVMALDRRLRPDHTRRGGLAHGADRQYRRCNRQCARISRALGVVRCARRRAAPALRVANEGETRVRRRARRGVQPPPRWCTPRALPTARAAGELGRDPRGEGGADHHRARACPALFASGSVDSA